MFPEKRLASIGSVARDEWSGDVGSRRPSRKRTRSQLRPHVKDIRCTAQILTQGED